MPTSSKQFLVQSVGRATPTLIVELLRQRETLKKWVLEISGNFTQQPLLLIHSYSILLCEVLDEKNFFVEVRHS